MKPIAIAVALLAIGIGFGCTGFVYAILGNLPTSNAWYIASIAFSITSAVIAVFMGFRKASRKLVD